MSMVILGFKCPSCDGEFVNENNHTCKVCDNLKCDCECPPLLLEVKTIPVTYQVEVKIHEWTNESSSFRGYDSFDSIEDCIRAWNWGQPRIGAHHWDSRFCHVAQNPTTNKWILLYL